MKRAFDSNLWSRRDVSQLRPLLSAASSAILPPLPDQRIEIVASMLAGIANWLISAPDFKGKYRLLKPLLRAADGQVVRSRYGVLFRNYPKDFTNYACVSGSYHADYDDVFAVVDAMQPGMAFIDIGANGGLFSMVAGKRVGSSGVVVAFEPNLPIYKQLVEHAVLNDVRRFFPFNAAVGDRTALMRFESGPSKHTGIGRLSASGDIEVLAMDLSGFDFVEKIVGERPTVIKIDVEGAEALVVRSISDLIARLNVTQIIIEIDEKNLNGVSKSSAAEIYDSLAKLGFAASRGMGAAAHFNEIFTKQDPRGAVS